METRRKKQDHSEEQKRELNARCAAMIRRRTLLELAARGVSARDIATVRTWSLIRLSAIIVALDRGRETNAPIADVLRAHGFREPATTGTVALWRSITEIVAERVVRGAETLPSSQMPPSDEPATREGIRRALAAWLPPAPEPDTGPPPTLDPTYVPF